MIPTAKEIYLNKITEVSLAGDNFEIQDSIDAMIEFSKLHVEAALKEASEKAIRDNIIDNCDDHTPYYGACQSCGRHDNFKRLTSDEDKIQNSILNAYPLENIK